MSDAVPHGACDCGQEHPLAELQYRPVVSRLAPGLVVTGQPPIPTAARAAMPPQRWLDEDIELVLDVTWRGAPLAGTPAIPRVWLPVQDDGTPRDPRWFDAIADAVGNARSVLVHCHLGVARAPSVAFALLLCRGIDPTAALELVLRTRPIATAAYAADALAWWLGTDRDDERVRTLDEHRAVLIDSLRTPLLLNPE